MGETLSRYRAVCDDIAAAEQASGRAKGSARLIAVSKTVAGEGILPVLAAGQRLFGENYVQETAGKWPALRDQFPDVELHMIGPLQSNKAQEAVRLFDVIQSVDRESLARELAKAMEKTGRRPKILVQVNTGAEPQKAGIADAKAIDGFLKRCVDEFHLPVIGLMCIPPFDQPPADHFRLLAAIAERNGLPCLSMGMSADYKEAISLGATHVRVGTAIFGSRS